MKRGGDGEDVRLVAKSGKRMWVGDEDRVCSLTGELEAFNTGSRSWSLVSEVCGGESLRFFVEDVMETGRLQGLLNKAGCLKTVWRVRHVRIEKRIEFRWMGNLVLARVRIFVVTDAHLYKQAVYIW